MEVTEKKADSVLTLKDVSKGYGSLEVLKGLSLSVRAGEVYGFLGRNGAGKSTAIRIMLGITAADRGVVSLFGEAQAKNPVAQRQRIGYVAQEQNFYRWMTPVSVARFVRDFYPSWSDAEFKTLLSRFSLPGKQKIGTFSGGMKAKLALSLALSTRPELLLLDEPTAGMDPVARREFLDLVREQSIQSGATVLFSTHLIDDIESVANRICIVDQGTARYEGELAPLSRSIKTYSAELQAALPVSIEPMVPGTGGQLLQHRKLPDKQLISVWVPDNLVANDPYHVAHLHELGWREIPMSLEDVFIAVVSA